MAEPIFKTIDYSNQIANNNKAASDSMVKGIQNISNTFLAGRQNNINQARQLMSDFDAVINEVDDMHKENVSGQIAKTQQQLANNIYKKKGKNGVRLQLGDMNSKDFNYARDMRKLKNMATNSRLVKQQLTDVKNNIKTDKYILSNADRANAAADVSTYLSSSEALSQSPEELNDQVRTIYRNYRDNVGEGVDLYVRDQVRTNSSSLGLDDEGNQILTSTAYFESLSKYNPETKQYEVDMDKIDAVAENYADKGNIIQSEKEEYKRRLVDRAQLVRTQKVQNTAIDLERKEAAVESAKVRDENTKASTAAIYKRLNDIDDEKVKETQLTEAENVVIKEIQNGAREGSQMSKAFLESISMSGKTAMYITNEKEYVDFVTRKAKEKLKGTSKKLAYIDEDGFAQTGSVSEAQEAYKRRWKELSKGTYDLDDDKIQESSKQHDFLVIDYPGNKQPVYIDLREPNSYEQIKRFIGIEYSSKEKRFDLYKYMFGVASNQLPVGSAPSNPQKSTNSSDSTNSLSSELPELTDKDIEDIINKDN